MLSLSVRILRKIAPTLCTKRSTPFKHFNRPPLPKSERHFYIKINFNKYAKGISRKHPSILQKKVKLYSQIFQIFQIMPMKLFKNALKSQNNPLKYVNGYFQLTPPPNTTTDKSNGGLSVVTSGAWHKIPPTRNLPRHRGTLLLLFLFLHPLHHHVSELGLELLDQWWQGYHHFLKVQRRHSQTNEEGTKLLDQW